jgi:chitinase
VKIFFSYITGIRFFLIFVVLFIFCKVLNAQNTVVAYYPDWMESILPPQDIEFQNLTYVFHAFAWPQSNGNIDYYSGMFNYGLANAAHNAGKKVLLALGGWGQSDGFAPMAADSLARNNFINNVVQLISGKNYDGVDFDWEFPANVTEGKNLTKLIMELRERFNQENPEWLITMAVSVGSYNGQYLEFSKLINYIDWFSMMGYDIHGSWTVHAGHNAPIYQPSNCSDGADDLGLIFLKVERQVPGNKILLGVPFYGKEFESTGLYQPITGSVTDLTYSDIAPRISSSNWEYNWDDFSRVPYLLNTEHTKFVTYDDTMSIRIKCDYAKENQLAGIMIWSLGQDLVSNKQPLLETIGKNMGQVTSAESNIEQNPKGFYLFDNYPNPFNPSTKIEYIVTETSMITLKVFDSLGREVTTLVNEIKSPGKYEVNFDGKELASGVYMYVLTSGNYSQIKKMILLK